ncbi:hypothetical protein [Kordia sp.]|uniref:hypothetical protein n=1 Tax=Kordia sp. TaxID=1965332 RepID=UPI0025C6F649|nr:hypothetical protein [Kordia sp.]MCH2194148.1 hypothetical protein [Kordia sp.]
MSFILLVVVCSCRPELTAEEVLQKSLDAHGGKALWETPKVLIYEKTTTFYDSLNKFESVKKQTFHNTLQPTFTSKVKWMEEDVEKRIVFDGKDTFVFTDGYQITDDSVVKAAHKEIMGAQYILWQPYKLFTDEATLENEGIVRLEDKTDAYMIKVTYPYSDTIWWYYFDLNTFILKENLIQHSKTTYSQIVNIQQEETTGLRLHQDRKSFKIDTGKDHKYLRATYHYKILELK